MALTSNMIKNKNNEPLDLKSRSLYARLKRLFSTDVVVRNIGGKKLKIVDTDSTMYATDRNTLRDRFNRVRTSGYSQYNRDFTMAYAASRIELFRDYDCVGPDTIIPLPDGSMPTIKELTERYKDKPQERFCVFSYDYKTNSIKLGKAFHPRKKGPRVGWKVTFDDGRYLIGSDRHPILMRSGEYKIIKDLKVGDSVMPFYQKDFFGRGYTSLYNFSRGWQTTHKIVAEQFYRLIESNEVVHHKNHIPHCNLPENLQIMTKEEHSLFHSIGGNNPFFGRIHTKESNEKRSKTLKKVFRNRNQNKERNPKYREDLTIDVLKIKASEFYKENGKLTLWDFIDNIGCDYSLLQNRLNWNNMSWNSFKNEVVSKLNHKIVSIECIGEIDVYDVTVEEYQNFATDICFVHNTMDCDPIISAALDIYADETTSQNELGRVLTVSSSDDNIKNILENLFIDIVNVEFNLWSWVRNMVKYGDFYLKLHISPEYGIYLVEPLSSYNVQRIENSDPNNRSYVKFQVSFETGVMEELENHQVAHFRLTSDSNFAPYGKSLIEGARRVWKQLSLLEDAMLIHRIMRAPEKRIFKIDVGNIPPQEVDTYMEKLIAKTKKVPYIDENTGDYNLRFNLQNMIEDFYIPVRGSDSGTSIEPLSGMEFTGIDDIEYVRNKMLAALKIPKAYLSFEEDLSGKATLAAEDLRFAKTVHRIQKIIISELNKLAVIHLYAQGYTDENLVNFKLELTNPSTILEKEKIDIWSNKMGVVKDMLDTKTFSSDFIYKNIFKLTDGDITENKNKIIEDVKRAWRITQIEEEGNDPAMSMQKVEKNGELSDVADENEGESEEPGGETGGGTESMPPIDMGMGGKEGGESPEKKAEPEGGAESPPQLKEVSRDYRNRPSQKGEKHARDYSFGEDPLGNMELNAGFESARKPGHKYKNNSPLGLDESDTFKMKSLASFLKSNVKRELLGEVKKTTKSLLDETNIKDE